MITNRLKKLPDSSSEEQEEMIDEIDELVAISINAIKNQKKRDNIRTINSLAL